MRTEGFKSVLLPALAIAALMVTSMAFVISTTTVSAPSTFSASPGATLSPTSARANTRVKFTVTVTNDYAADNIDNVILIGPGFSQPTDLELTTWVLSEITYGVRFDAIGDNVIAPGSSKSFVFLWTTPNIPADYMISVLVSKEEPVYTSYENLGGFIVTIEGLTPRAPIYIEGNAGFTLENGVNGGGSGTENDPYIIENWDISAGDANGIHLRNTNAYFVIRNCYIHDGRDNYNEGIWLDNVANGKIDNVILNNNDKGIYLNSSKNNLVTNNTVENNDYIGIHLYYSDNNFLSKNLVENNLYTGIYLGYSDNNFLFNNLVENNWHGIVLYYNSNKSLVSNNLVENNLHTGILLGYSDNNRLYNNLVENNRTFGIYLGFSDNNLIYHNNFVNNQNQAYDDGSNYWDDGYPSGGNYWSDYTGVDNYRGENQDIPGSDGIGDTPYYIPGDNNRDRYPLMNPWSMPDYVYLTWASPDTAHTMNVSWRTDGNYVGEVRYDTEAHGGEPDAYSYSAEGTGGVTTAKFNGYIHHVELTGLDPYTIYYFVCGNPDHGWSEELSFRTAPVEKRDIRFVAGGDSRSDTRPEYPHPDWPEARDGITQLMASYDPDFVIFTGDFLWNGETQEGGLDTWDNWLGAWYKYARAEDGRLIPMVPAIGNHELVYPQPSDYDPETHASNYYMLFNLPENERWYSLNWGPDLHIVVLDSEIRYTGSESWTDQLEWLGEDLLEHWDDRWKIATAHRPAFSSGHYSGDPNVQTYWIPEFDFYHVDLYFGGHDHNYQRTHPINFSLSTENYQPSPENGTIYMVSAGWGAPLYSGSPRWWTAYGPDARYHFTLIDVYENSTLRMQAIDIDNNIFDEICIQKERGVEVSISPSYQSGPPGTTLIYTLMVTNTGNVEDNYSLTVSDNENWGPTISPMSLTVPAGENRTATLSVTVPENAVPCTEDNIRVVATSMENAEVSASESCIAHVASPLAEETKVMYPIADVYAFGDENGYSRSQLKFDISGIPSGAGIISAKLWLYRLAADDWDGDIALNRVEDQAWDEVITASEFDAQTLTDEENHAGKFMSYGWDYLNVSNQLEVDHGVGNAYTSFRLRWANDSGGEPSVGIDDNRFLVINSEANELSIVFCSSEYDGNNPHLEVIYLLPHAVSASISPSYKSGSPGEMLSYSVTITNTGNLDDNYDLTVSDSLGWGPMVSPSLLTVAAGASGTATLTVTIPGGAENGAEDDITVTATSRADPTVSDSASCTARAIALRRVEVSISPDEQSGGPGETLTYTITVKNTGNVMDNYDLTANDNTNWSLMLPETLTDVIPGESKTVNLSVGIPYNVENCTKDNVTVTVTSRIDNTVEDSASCIAHAIVPEVLRWDALITATFSEWIDDAIFGVRPDATSGFDSTYDLPEPPPPFEPPYVQAFFHYPGNAPPPTTRLHRSCIPPGNIMEWPLRVSYRNDTDNITLSWNLENVPTDYTVLLLKGRNLVADMRAVDNYTFEAASGDHDFKVIVGALVPFTLELTQGWNMISFPVRPENSSPDSIFDGYYALYGWDSADKRYVLHADSGSFIEPDPDVEVGVGYWAYVLEDENVTLLGVPVSQLTLDLCKGWNLVGPPYGGSSIADPADHPDNSVVPWAFNWNAEERSYRMTQLLEAGKGYWVYTLRYCSLTLPPKEPRKCVLAIEHFSIIAGTTWSGAHDRAAKRLVAKYPSLEYVYREEVGPNLTNPFAEELIATEGADIVVGNAEFMGLPLKDIADDYPDVYFVSIIASDLTTKRNFIRYFPRQYQALYLEGLIAGALTETGNIGIVSAFPCIQVCRRQSGFYLGVMDAAEMLGKDITLYVKYVGDWYLPTEEAEVARALIDSYNCDIITQQTDSGSPLDVAEKKGIWFVGKDMDIVGQYGWSSTETVAVSFDTRWEVGYEMMIKDWMSGETNPETILYPGMDAEITLTDGTVYPTVDIQNDNKVGIEAISPYARPLISDNIIELIENKRNLLLEGKWDPFLYELRSNGTGLDLPGLPVPPKGTVVKPEGEMPTDEWLLSKFNFDLEGVVVLA